MDIDNSSYVAFSKCPLYYFENYVRRLERPMPWLAFGSRFHKTLESHYLSQPCPAPPDDFPAQDEAVVQSMFQAYLAHYPEEPFKVIDCERVFRLSIPGTLHNLTGKMDMVIRHNDTGRISVFETKTEKRGSRRNSPRAWKVKTQGTLYYWATQQIYGEAADFVLLNVCTKPSDKGQVPATFRRDILERTPEQVQQALNDIAYVADQIGYLEASYKDRPWPRNSNACVEETGFSCDYDDIHNTGEIQEMLSVYKEREDYLGNSNS